MKKIKCMVCQRTFMNAIPGPHLAKHGLTRDEYRKQYGPVSVKEQEKLIKQEFTEEKLFPVLTQNIREGTVSKEIDSLVDSSLKVYNEKMTKQVLGFSHIIMSAKIDMYMKACVDLGKVMEESRQEWRLKQDELGRTISSKELREQAYFLANFMRDTERYVGDLQRTVVQDQRNVVNHQTGAVQAAFSGEWDKSPMSGMGKQQREKLRDVLDAIEVANRAGKGQEVVAGLLQMLKSKEQNSFPPEEVMPEPVVIEVKEEGGD